MSCNITDMDTTNVAGIKADNENGTVAKNWEKITPTDFELIKYQFKVCSSEFNILCSACADGCR